MKPAFEALQPDTINSFLLREFKAEAFTAPYHYHPEYELTLIKEGSGKRYIGSHMESFGPQDLVLLGPNVPHCWKLGSLSSDLNANAVVVQFTADFLGIHFFEKKELEAIKQLLVRSTNGVYFEERTARKVHNQLVCLQQEENNFRRLLLLLSILQELASATDFKLLDTNRYIIKPASENEARINKIITYIIENYKNEISLAQVSEYIGMTPNALCKYIKKVTRKTLVEIINEYRLNYAMHLLVDGDQPVGNICFESGFNDVSYFYKLFKLKMGVSPSKYRKNFAPNI